MPKKSLSNSVMTDSAEEFNTLYKTNSPLIYRFMFWRTQNDMLAQDLTSNVFEKAWRTRHNFTEGSATAWLYTIARTTLIDHWRKKKDILTSDQVLSQTIADPADLTEAYDTHLEISKLRQAVIRLPEDMRHVIQLRFIEELSARETAQRLNISEGNVRVIQYRALKQLREYLNDKES